MMWSSGRDLLVKEYVWIGLLTGIVPSLLAFLSYWLAPWGCDANAWLCLLPLALLVLAPFAALWLPVLFYINQRMRHTVPDGWLPIIFLSGVVSQVMSASYGLWRFQPYLEYVDTHEVLLFPQGFAAGAIIGLVFWVSRASIGSRISGP
jgi:hypothetical protein